MVRKRYSKPDTYHAMMPQEKYILMPKRVFSHVFFFKIKPIKKVGVQSI